MLSQGSILTNNGGCLPAAETPDQHSLCLPVFWTPASSSVLFAYSQRSSAPPSMKQRPTHQCRGISQCSCSAVQLSLYREAAAELSTALACCMQVERHFQGIPDCSKPSVCCRPSSVFHQETRASMAEQCCHCLMNLFPGLLYLFMLAEASLAT